MSEDQAKKDLAEAFRNMMSFGAWRHFELIINRVAQQALKDEDAMDLKDFNAAYLGECRGRRNAIKKIWSDLDYILSA